MVTVMRLEPSHTCSNFLEQAKRCTHTLVELRSNPYFSSVVFLSIVFVLRKWISNPAQQTKIFVYANVSVQITTINNLSNADNKLPR